MKMAISLSPELERRIAEKVESGEYSSADELIRECLHLLEVKEKSAPGGDSDDGQSLAEAFAAIAKNVPDSEWAKLPVDFSKNFKHYLYGSQKSSE